MGRLRDRRPWGARLVLAAATVVSSLWWPGSWPCFLTGTSLPRRLHASHGRVNRRRAAKGSAEEPWDFLKAVRDSLGSLEPVLQQKVDTLTAELEEQRQELAATKAALSEEQAARDAAEEAQKAAEKIAADMGLKVERLESELKAAEQQGEKIVATLKSQNAKLHDELLLERKTNAELREQVAALQGSYSEISDRLEFSDAQMKKLEQVAEEKEELLKLAEGRLSGVRDSLRAAGKAFMGAFKKRRRDDGGD